MSQSVPEFASIRKFSSSQDSAAVERIADEVLGNGYFQALPGMTILVAEHQRSVVAFVAGWNTLDKSVLKTICVTRSSQRHGIAKALGRLFLAAVPKGVPVESPAWRYPDGEVPSSRLLEELGFIPGETIEDYWYDDSLARKTTCPECGEPPCHCAAIIFRRRPL